MPERSIWRSDCLSVFFFFLLKWALDNEALQFILSSAVLSLRACPSSHGLPGFKPMLVFLSKHVFSVTVCICEQGRRKRSKPSHKYKSDPIVFLFSVCRSSSLTYLKAYKPASRSRRLFFHCLFLERLCLFGAFSLYFLLSWICDT